MPSGASNLTISGGSLDLNGYGPTVKALNGAGVIGNSTFGASNRSLLTVSNGGAFPGTIQDGLGGGTAPVSLEVTGGKLILSGTDTYSGDTLIEGGDLVLTENKALPAHDVLIVGPGGVLIFDPLAGPPTFSGSATWTSTSGRAWNSAVNWTDNNGQNGVPGVAPRPSNTDTATFSGSGSVTAIDLTGVAPSLKALTFSTSNYSLSGGSLALQGNSGPATVTVSGTQSIGSLLSLAGSADMIVTNSSDRLTLSGQVVGTGGLLKDGAGTLVLSGGANTYGGGTVVNAGTLIVTSSVALPAGTNVTIGPGGTLIFDPTATSSPMVSGQAGPATVPEPSTLVLLSAGTVSAMLARRSRRKC